MKKEADEDETLEAIHRSLCKFFDAKVRSDWKDHEVACLRWYDEGFKIDLTSFTFDIYFYKNHSENLTNTDFKQNFSSLKHGLKKVKSELHKSATKRLWERLDRNEYSWDETKKSIPAFLEDSQNLFTYKFEASIEKILKQLESDEIAQKSIVWKKYSKTKPHSPTERDIAFEIIRAHYHQYESLPFARNSFIQANAKLLTVTQEIYSVLDLAKGSRAACRDALHYSKKIFGLV